MKTIIKELETIAKANGYTVKSEEVGNAVTLHYGKVFLKEKLIRIYFQNDFDRLIVLAHEVGHVKTTIPEKYLKRIVYYEKLASSWGLNFLSNKLGKEALARAKKFYAQCLESYK